MKVFLSWSGDRSLKVARALHEFLPQIINAVDPFLSKRMEKGTRWNSELASALETDFGIICLARENLDAPYLLFEAGALSKTAGARVWTLLLGIKPTDVSGPLEQFQHTLDTKEEIFQLIQDINANVRAKGERGIPDDRLRGYFDDLWDKLAPAFTWDEVSTATTPPIREARELLEELLERVRDLPRLIQASATSRRFRSAKDWLGIEPKAKAYQVIIDAPPNSRQAIVNAIQTVAPVLGVQLAGNFIAFTVESSVPRELVALALEKSGIDPARIQSVGGVQYSKLMETLEPSLEAFDSEETSP